MYLVALFNSLLLKVNTVATVLKSLLTLVKLV